MRLQLFVLFFKRGVLLNQFVVLLELGGEGTFVVPDNFGDFVFDPAGVLLSQFEGQAGVLVGELWLFDHEGELLIVLCSRDGGGGTDGAGGHLDGDVVLMALQHII